MATLTLDLPEAPRAQAAYRLAADCPRCGAPLVLRQNRQSAALFTGCSAYPSCAFAEPHDPRVQTLRQRRWSRCKRRLGARWRTPRPTPSGTWPQSGPRWIGPCGSSSPWPILTAGRTRRWRMSSPWPWWRCARRCSLARSVCRLRAGSAPLVEDGRVTGTRGTGRAQRRRCQPRGPSGADRDGKARVCASALPRRRGSDVAWQPTATVTPQTPGHVSRRCPQGLGTTGHRDGRTAVVQGTSPSCLLEKPGEEPGERKARTGQARACSIPWRGIIGRVAAEGADAMSKVLELSEELYQQLTTLAAYQQRPLEDMLRLCLLAYEQYQYHLVHQQMVAEGLLEALPPLHALDAVDAVDDDFEPEVIPGTPLSEIILEDRR